MVEPKKNPQTAAISQILCSVFVGAVRVVRRVVYVFFGSESHKMNSPRIINHKATARKLISRHYDYLNEEVVAGQS